MFFDVRVALDFPDADSLRAWRDEAAWPPGDYASGAVYNQPRSRPIAALLEAAGFLSPADDATHYEAHGNLHRLLPEEAMSVYAAVARAHAHGATGHAVWLGGHHEDDPDDESVDLYQTITPDRWDEVYLTPAEAAAFHGAPTGTLPTLAGVRAEIAPARSAPTPASPLGWRRLTPAEADALDWDAEAETGKTLPAGLAWQPGPDTGGTETELLRTVARLDDERLLVGTSERIVLLVGDRAAAQLTPGACTLQVRADMRAALVSEGPWLDQDDTVRALAIDGEHLVWLQDAPLDLPDVEYVFALGDDLVVTCNSGETLLVTGVDDALAERLR